MKPQDITSFEFMGALTLVQALVELYRPKAEAAARTAIHAQDNLPASFDIDAQDNLPASFDIDKFIESCGDGLELHHFAIFMEKADKLGSPTHVPIAIAGVYKRTDNINDFIAKETKAFLENIPKEWEEYWLRAFAERLKDFLDVIDSDNASAGEDA